MATCPTVKVKDDSARGYRIINASDFDPDVHIRYAGEVDWDLARNGYWTVYKGDEEVASGRGRDTLDDALADYNVSRHDTDGA